ncbi:hypothetical protein VYU27_002560 [Nannochloropsis oceanica]
MSPAAGLGYTLRVEGRLAEAKARALGPKDVVALFGAFEPYNIVIHPPGAVGGGAKYQAKKGSSLPPPPPVLATFQVPSLKYAQEIAQSFQQDETWGERITVHQEKETFPVFISGLPEGVKGEELKEQIESAAACDPKQLKASGEPEPNGEFDPEVKAKSESLLARTAIDVYDSYAVFKCPDKFTSLGLLQGSFQLTPAGEGGNGLESKQQAASEEGEITAPAGEVLSPISAVGGEQQGGEGEEDDENDPSAVLSYAAWKTYPVRVNGLPADATVEEVMATFRKYMPYDVELLPVESGTRGAYLRFARRVQGTECVAEMKDVTVRGDKTLEVRRAWEKAFPILIEGGEEGRKTTVEELRQLVTTLRMNKDLHVLDAELVEGGAAAIVRFGSQPAAEEGMKLLSAGVGGRGKRVSLAWRDFRVDLNNLPLEVTEEELREMVHLTTPSKVRVSAPIGGKRRSGSVSFTTRPEAELAFSQLSGTGLPDLKLRKAWAVYRLRVKGLPLDTTEEDVREILKGGYEPFQVDFPRSRKGNLKGEAVLRFAAYDQVVAAIGRLYGRDSPLDEAEHQARWTTAGEGISFDDPYGSLAEEVERMSTAEEGKEGMKKGGKEASNAQQELDAMVEKALEGEEGMEELVHRTAPFLKEGDDMSRHGEEGGTERGSGLGLSPEDEKEEEEEEEEDEDEGRDKESVNPFGIYPEGKWVKMLVDTDTTQKIIKGGHILSYRALVVVGNLNGCGGYGVGKAPSMEEAQIRAYRAAKKNLIHVDLYRNRCVTTALYGKHNNCRIYIQAGHPGRPHKEGRMINDILRVLGVECGEARSVGRRNPYSVVRAIFHAISKHEGVEELSRKRGRRLISVSKARYLGL